MNGSAMTARVSDRTGLARGLSLALLLAVGYFTVHVFVAGTGQEFAQSFARPHARSKQLVVDRDGRAFHQVSLGHPYVTTTTFDLDGNEVTDDELVKAIEPAPSTFVHPPQRRDPGDLSEEWLPLLGMYELARVGVTETTQRWHLCLAAPGRPLRYLEGYDRVSRQRIGYVSKRGFSVDRPAESDMWPSTCKDPKGLAGYVGKTFLIAAPDGVWRFDPKKRTVDRVIPDVSLLCFATPSSGVMSTGQREDPQPTLTTDGKKWFVLDGERFRLRELQLELDGDRAWGMVFGLAEGRLLMDLTVNRKGVVRTTELYWVDAKGMVTDRKQIAAYSFNIVPPMISSPELGGALFAATVPVPLFAVIANLWHESTAYALRDSGYQATDADAKVRRENVAWLFVCLVLGGVCAWWCDRHARRHRINGRVAWIAFVILLGLPGLVGYWCHRRWPVLPISEWVTTGKTTPPALKGTEVFA